LLIARGARGDRQVEFRWMVALLCAAVPLLVSAQNDSPDVSEPNPVVVTASRIEEPLAAAVVSVTIITRADVDRLRPRSVADLLQGMAGVSVVNNGGLGETTSVSIRGTNYDQVLVLIDGIKIGSTTTGTAAWEQHDVGVDHGALLPRTARFIERLDLDRASGPLGVGATLIEVDPRYEDPANTERMGGYGTLDLRASCCCGRTGEVQVLFANASNRSYETPLYYNLPGRSAYLTLRYVPQSHT